MAHDPEKHLNKTLIFWRKQNICSCAGGRRKTLEKFFPNKTKTLGTAASKTAAYFTTSTTTTMFGTSYNKNKKVKELNLFVLKIKKSRRVVNQK